MSRIVNRVRDAAADVAARLWLTSVRSRSGLGSAQSRSLRLEADLKQP